MSQAAENSRSRHLSRRRCLAAMAFLTIVSLGTYFLLRPSVETLVQESQQHFDMGDWQESLNLSEVVLARDAGSIAALVLAGDACFSLEEYDRALAYYRQVPVGPSAIAIHARFRCGRIELHHVADTARAEASFRAALSYEPENPNGLFQLVSLLGIQARQQEAVPFVLRLFRQGVFHEDLLGLLESPGSALFNLSELNRYRQVTPEHPAVLIGLAWHARNSGQTEEAIELLAEAVRSKPPIPESRIALAMLLWETSQFVRVESLLAEEQTCSISDPRLWVVRGKLAERNGQSPAAVRCFWETWQQSPTDRNATYQLYQYLIQSDDEARAKLLQERLQQLQTLREQRDLVVSTEHSTSQPIRQLVMGLERVERLWEAWGWCIIANDRFPAAAWAMPRATTLLESLQSSPLTVVCRSNRSLAVDLSHLPLPKWNSKSQDGLPSPGGSDKVVSFRDDSRSAGIHFQYYNSPSTAGEGQRMYEFNGGGCGVLDYDMDGWPDLYFTQGCQWDRRDERSEHVDQFFRNSGNGRFDDVTGLAGTSESRFSTGITVGDFDNDGFPDLHIANIGRNRLYRNCGDGTFEDVTNEAGVDDPRWSTSCVMADLNGDSLPDLYSVNYLTGESVFERVCQHEDGQPRMCMPFHFPAAQDQLFLNLGDGRFSNVTEECGVQVANGKGLGVVAADWKGDGRLSLFVANDTVGNFLFVNDGTSESGIPRFVESGLIAGVAVNGDGKAEGCMGIAVGDANDDGGLDLFVTNFLRESNTLYQTSGDATFTDVTQPAGLAEPGRNLLGFGTQFLDADLDGHLDLLVANGHIDDYRRYGRPYRMPAQCFANNGNGRFTEQPAHQLGPYFSRKLLGRGLARVDWNRDGREDAVISHLDQPAVLLTNTTEQPGQFVAVRLRGVQSSRDAIGTTVLVHTQDRTMMRQLTAGDGYQASNERVLVFGLGRTGQVRRIEVRWPTGKNEAFDQIESDQEYLIVEGAGQLFRVR